MLDTIRTALFLSFTLPTAEEILPDLDLQSRVVDSMKPIEELTSRDRIESVLHSFHKFVLEESANAEAAARAGIIQLESPDVYGQIVMPNITAFQVKEDEDPAIYLMEAAQSLYFMATNTLMLAAQAISTRGPSHAPLSDHLHKFASMSNENMSKLMLSIFMDSSPASSSRLVDVSGKTLH